jgi:hypothetical protein
VKPWTWTDIWSMTENSEKPDPGPQRRIFPPLYKSSGDLASDRLAFFHILERLKVCLFHHHQFMVGLAYSICFCSFCRVSYRRHRSERDGSITMFGSCSSSDVIDRSSLTQQHKKNYRSQTRRGNTSLPISQHTHSPCADDDGAFIVVVAYRITCTAWPCLPCAYQTNHWTLQSE